MAMYVQLLGNLRTVFLNAVARERVCMSLEWQLLGNKVVIPSYPTAQR